VGGVGAGDGGSSDPVVENEDAEDYEPIKTLFAMRKVLLSPGQTKSVSLSSNMLEGHCSFCSFDASGGSKVRPGTFTITIGDGGNGKDSNILTYIMTSS
jgi:hypothetical protein